MHCILCLSTALSPYHQDTKRAYWQCANCELVTVEPDFWLTPDAERAEYDKHENSLEDVGYLKFLARAYQPVLNLVTAPAKGLDFGCGPAPALAHHLNQQGYDVSYFDKFYFPDTATLEQTFDFITCTEVIEHLSTPRAVLTLFQQQTNPGGIWVIMTKRVISLDAFRNWHYKNDPTHIAFYSDATFDWIAQHFKMTIIERQKDVVVLKDSTR
ncbi:MAG: class I SAM-dependent methyltransferase [Gammaproteobacteria bacterium]|nr:class I SAM-dependent methyltransferase [Gammaproteobacteria bacterium]NVK87183.1 class I SAM-dependent methyltransferase [Gammaproteobacteria bacterium]